MKKPTQSDLSDDMAIEDLTPSNPLAGTITLVCAAGYLAMAGVLGIILIV